MFIHPFIFREREREGGREEEKTAMCERYIDYLSLARPQMGTRSATQACALTGNRTSDLLVCRLALNPLSYSSQGPLFLSFFLFFKTIVEKVILEERKIVWFNKRPTYRLMARLHFGINFDITQYI